MCSFEYLINIHRYSEISFANQYAACGDWSVLNVLFFSEISPRDMPRLSNRSVIQICTIC